MFRSGSSIIIYKQFYKFETKKKRSKLSSPSALTSLDFKSLAAQAIVSLSNKKPITKYQAFGEYISSKLQSLPEGQQHLRQKF